MKKYLAEASKRKKETANEILSDTGLIDIFSLIGEVMIIGSLKLDLMFRNDIDLLVISENIERSLAKDLTTKLLQLNRFQTVALADYQKYPEDDFPKGFYWELIIIKDHEKWKFDIWYLDPAEEYAQLVLQKSDQYLKLLEVSPEKKDIILEIKKAYFDGIKYKNGIKSVDIYDAVLRNKIRSTHEFTKMIDRTSSILRHK